MSANAIVLKVARSVEDAPKYTAPEYQALSKEQLARLHEILSNHLEAMSVLFTPDVKLTLLARKPNDHEADVLITADDLDEVIAGLKRSQAREVAISGRASGGAPQ